MKVENDSDIYRNWHDEPTTRRAGPRQQRRSQWWILVLAVVTRGPAGDLRHFAAHSGADRAAPAKPREMAVPTVAVVQPKRSAPAQEIVLPANVQAFADAPIYARTNGYLKRWYVDIGSHVKAGPAAGGNRHS